ncbi:hypothetical protein HPB47_024424 [Ixodes persulcatus]|uniref:Uncharacterized protein n=1 Tax=Ixodes persulcatus TaxID=34615 RepID=A0AC60Q4S4_IXOPE|nr:hypothetical protein HPB47_024424 [Ixodes persulcatus]
MDFKEPQKVMRFHTDESQSDRGFHIAVKQNECDSVFSTPATSGHLDCDETFSKPEGQIVSLNFPQNYGNNLDCRYTVRKMSSSVCRLEMRFMRFDVESSTNCEYDYLDIDGQKLCGIFSGNTSGMYDFEGNEKVIRFHSDAANSRPGFQIQMRQHECALQSPRPPPARPLQGLGPVDEGHRQPPPQQQKCDKIFTSRLFDIRSLGYPRGYPNDLDCKYIVFQMVFRFRTDHSSNRPGFHIKARQVECGSRVPPVTNLGKAPALGVPCTYEFCDRSGVFYSQGFPGPYPNQMSCTYRVLALPGHCRVELSFVQFNLESHKKPDGQCGADFMEINNVRYCNRQLEGQISLPPGVPDGPVPAEPPSLFEPGLEPQSPDTHRQPSCDRLYALREFELESPGYPSSYPPGLDCRYFIRRLNDGVCALRVTFNSFDLEDSPSCHNDYFEVDGHKICGQLPPGKAKEVPLRDFQTTFRFHSNGAVEHRGFLVQVVQVPCQGPPSFDAQPSPPGRYPHHSAMGPAGHPHPHPGKKPPKRLSNFGERLKGQHC